MMDSEYLKEDIKIVEPYPSFIEACEYCGCFKRVVYVNRMADSQMICDECLSQFFQEG
jgi:hypothetical protein